jgi:hypothetical protein
MSIRTSQRWPRGALVLALTLPAPAALASAAGASTQ